MAKLLRRIISRESFSVQLGYWRERKGAWELMHILHAFGARPNFVKAASLIRVLQGRKGIRQTLVHTGQHFDDAMSTDFQCALGMPKPEVNLGVGSGSHAQQTAEIIRRIEPVLLEFKPDLVLVYGDVNSTLASALVCAKLLVPMGHVESGLRSFDRTMAEETNRLLTDHVADLLFTPSTDADTNLLREGVEPSKIHRVGNVMIDTLVTMLPQAVKRWDAQQAAYGLKRYGLVTLHRPSNVDSPAILASFVDMLDDISQSLPLIFSIHPRTRKRLDALGVSLRTKRLQGVGPLDYLDFLSLQHRATLLITDSGGIQEEATYLGVPCLTLRDNTERPVTVSLGTNVLVGRDANRLRIEVERILAGNGKRGQIPPLWDGHAADRIVDVILGRSG